MANNSSTRRYVALTTQGQGWWVEVMGEPGQSQDDVRQAAMDKLLRDAGGSTTDIYYETWRKNLEVVSYSAAKRAFPAAMRHYDYAEEVGIPY